MACISTCGLHYVSIGQHWYRVYIPSVRHICRLHILRIQPISDQKYVAFFFISRNFQNAKFEFATHQPLFTSCLENPMDGGAWWATVHGVATSLTRLSDFTFIFHFPALEKEMATHSSVLAWRIAGMAEPGRLPSMGSHRVGHD